MNAIVWGREVGITLAKRIKTGSHVFLEVVCGKKLFVSTGITTKHVPGWVTECERGNKGNTILWRDRIVRLRHLMGMQNSNVGRADIHQREGRKEGLWPRSQSLRLGKISSCFDKGCQCAEWFSALEEWVLSSSRQC